MIIYIRADSSVDIGTGHIMRCLTLANKLKAANCEVSFICKSLKGNIAQLVREYGFEAHMSPVSGDEEVQPQDLRHLKNGRYLRWLKNELQFTREVLAAKAKNGIDWLIADHYLLDWRWEISLKPYVNKIMVIDDLANRWHFADILLDQNYSPDMESKYDGLVPPSCKCFIGPRYCLLRPEFVAERTKLKNRTGKIDRILVFFGGSDLTGETLKTLQALRAARLSNVHIDVVVGVANPLRQEIAEVSSQMPQTKFYCQTDEMAKLMAQADLAIGAVGTTTWERCYLGLPTIAVAVADNQAGASWLADYGIIVFLGKSNEVSAEKITQAVNKLIKSPSLVCEMSRKCFEIMQGHQEDKIVSHLMQ